MYPSLFFIAAVMEVVGAVLFVFGSRLGARLLVRSASQGPPPPSLPSPCLADPAPVLIVLSFSTLLQLLFLAGVTPVMHQFWAPGSPAQQEDRINCERRRFCFFSFHYRSHIAFFELGSGSEAALRRMVPQGGSFALELIIN